MSFFDKIFGRENNEVNSNVNWIPLTAISQLDEIVENSKNKTIVIFKHSTRCSISRFALKQFENEYSLEDKVDLYFLDLLNYREVSNEITNRFQVVHQSPQLLIIKNGVAVYDASHSDIQAEVLGKYV
ncbi:bacillithiol system redox-active protein YtxJ [Flavobacterium haoranii]|uniref:Bacillithiol system protein YtxJ n=1 Tax=Flavobacterium haoranii TaxID=683124 RepID=A0A1M6L2Y2_9FLAO|nr:bacillithiol system redox-active protein YtxJ [Flavobacterium haoranii]SHJ65494.1 bacillithiol system protein YtxJ [Flavobacterium haoranii]